MAIFNQSPSSKRDVPPAAEPAARQAPDSANDPQHAKPQHAAPVPTPSARATERSDREPLKESLIAADLTIEGKIEGAGHIRIAGRFKGDVHVKGDLTIEHGAKLTGGVRARKVVVAGELDGNVEAAARVELVESGVMIGDVKAGVLIVAAGSKMRGQVEFGWDDKDGDRKSGAGKNGNGNAETGAAA